MPEPIVPAVAPIGAPSFEQHPDDMIVTRKLETPAAPAPTAAEVAAADESFEKLKEQLPELLFGDKPKTPVAATPAAPVVPAVDPAAPAVIDPAAPEPVAPERKVKVTKQPSAEELARIQGEAIGRAMNERQAQAAAPVTTEPTTPVADAAPAHFSDADKENWELFKVLSDSDPRYKDKHKEFATFVDKLSIRKRQYEKANPGQAYDPDDDKEFFDKHEPAYTTEDLDVARIRRETTKEVDKRTKALQAEYDKKLQELESKAMLPETNREADRVAAQATATFVEELPDATIKAALAKGGDDLKNTDPLAFDVLNNAAGDLQNNVRELHSIINRPGHYNPANALHKNLASFIDAQETHIKGLPMAQQVFEGKVFATRNEYQMLPAAARASRWVLTEPDVVHMLTRATSHKAMEAITKERARMEQLAPKYGYTKTAPASPATQTPAAAPALPASPAARKPASPSAVSGEAGQPLAQAPAGQPLSDSKKLVNALF